MHWDVLRAACERCELFAGRRCDGQRRVFSRTEGGAPPPQTWDTGDAPVTAPTAATNEYLDTTIAAGGGNDFVGACNGGEQHGFQREGVSRQHAEPAGGLRGAGRKHYGMRTADES